MRPCPHLKGLGAATTIPPSSQSGEGDGKGGLGPAQMPRGAGGWRSRGSQLSSPLVVSSLTKLVCELDVPPKTGLQLLRWPP